MDLNAWEVNEEQLKEFRDWSNKQEQLPQIPDEYLARFLHSCYFDMEKAKKAISCYVKLKTKSPKLFSNRNLEEPKMKAILENCYLGILPTTTENGYSVIWGRLMSSDSSKFCTEDALKYMYMTVDRLMLERRGCRGIVFVYDTDNVTLRHIIGTSLSTIRSHLEYLQDAVPMRHKTVHLINVGAITTHLMTIIRPFIYKHHLKKINFHPANNINGLYNEIKKEEIPSDYGGSAPSLDTLQEENIMRIKSFSDWFKSNESLKLLDTKNTDCQGNGFQHLNID